MSKAKEQFREGTKGKFHVTIIGGPKYNNIQHYHDIRMLLVMEGKKGNHFLSNNYSVTQQEFYTTGQ